MKKILFILAFIPLLVFGQGTQNLTVKRVKTDSLYVYKLESISSSGIVLVLDSLTGKVGKRPYSSGCGDSYWQELTGNLANIDTTTGFYVNSTSGVKNVNLSMYPASSWWRIEQSNRTTGVQSVAQGSAGVVSLQANAGGATDIVQVNGAGYLYGRTGSNGLNLGSSTYRWGLLYSDSVNTKTIYANGRAYGVGVYGQSEYSNGIKGLSDKSSGVLGLTVTGTAVQGTATGAGKAGSFTATGGGEGIYISAPTGAYAAAIFGNVGIGKTNPSTAIDVTGTITATGGTSTDWNAAAGWVTTNGGNVSNWNTAYGWGNHSGLYIPLPESGITAGDIWYGGDTKTETISKPAGEDNYTLKWMGGTGGTPSWQTEDWTQSGEYIIRHNRVGIGIDNPLYWLHVSGAVKSDTNITPLVLGGSAVSSSLTLQSTSGTGSSDYIAFKTGSGSERFRVTSGGNVGIGTTAPTTALQVTGAVKASTYFECGSYVYHNANGLYYNNANGGRIVLSATEADIYTSGVSKVKVTSSGNVGIGTTVPAAKLHVAGGIMLDGKDTTGVGATSKVGTIQYYNGNFYGLKAGTPPTWVQLNN